MATQRTRWRPDTCACVVEYEWNDEVPEADLVLTPVLIDPCPLHPATGDLAADFATVRDHNRTARPAEV